MGNRRNRRCRRGQSPSLVRDLRDSEAEVLQSNKILIETLSNFDDVSSVRGIEAVSIDATRNENEMQVLTQKMADKTNKEMSELTKKKWTKN